MDDKLDKFYGISIDELIYMNGKIPDGITIIDKSVNERLKLIGQLEKEDKMRFTVSLIQCSQNLSSKTSFRKMWRHCKMKKLPLGRFWLNVSILYLLQ